MEPLRDENELAATLRSLRQAPRPAFAAALDERAAAGFPRRAGQRTGRPATLGRRLARLRPTSPRRLLLAGGATALAAIAAATVLASVNQGGSDVAPPAGARHPGIAAAGGSLSRLAPFANRAQPQPLASRSGHAAAGSGQSSRGTAGAARASEEAASTPRTFLNGSASYYDNRARLDSGAGLLHRDVERAAELTLGAASDEVGRKAARVSEAVHANRGVVLNSSVREGGNGEAGARFNLLVPSAKLDDTLAAIAAIGKVRSQHRATADITAATVGLGERLQDARAKVAGLLRQLASAETDAAREAAEAELRAARRQTATLRSRFAALRRRAQFSRVLVRIETGSRMGAAGGGNGDWGVGDAFHDAGRVLGVAAGVVVVGLAALAPLALLVLLAWLASRAWLRHRRERALG